MFPTFQTVVGELFCDYDEVMFLSWGLSVCVCQNYVHTDLKSDTDFTLTSLNLNTFYTNTASQIRKFRGVSHYCSQLNHLLPYCDPVHFASV